MPKLWIQACRILLVAALAVGVVGCASAAEPANDKPLVLTTFTVIADMVRVVGGDAVEVESITKVGAEIHGYEPTPSDLKRAAAADLILDNGFGLERWFEAFVSRIDVPHAVLTEGIEPIDIRIGDYAGLPNPHSWMSPMAGQRYVDNIADALGELVPGQAALFTANAAGYKAELQALADELTAVVEALPEQQRVLVTCEGAFSYLARDIGLTEGYLWPVNSDTQGTPQQIKAAIELVREGDVPAVFCETTVNEESQRQVARESGANFGGLLYVDSLSEAGGPVPTYLDLLRYDVDLIAEGLSQ
ncbi:MAG TPA: metal ABC transporter substrate-binding protein [Homoserinimonas sp.]|nr:metal ABC transporter substrate-binding protein [Homoserinimonas sp.]